MTNQNPVVKGLPDTVNTALLFELQRCLKVVYESEEMVINCRKIQYRIAELDRQISSYQSELNSWNDNEKKQRAIFILIASIIFTGPFIVIAFPVALIYWIHISKTTPQKIVEYTEKVENCKTLMVEETQKLAKLEEEFEEYAEIQRGEDLFRVLPPMYFHSPALEFMIDAVQKTLARDMHEAIVLYEQEEKRLEANAQIDDMIRAQRENTEDVVDAINLNTFITYLTSK